MLKITKTEINVEEFIKEVDNLFPGKFTEAGLKVLFEYIEDWKNGEYELTKIGEDFIEWGYEKYKEYLINRFGTISDTKEEKDSITNEDLQTFLRENVYEDDWKNSVVGFTNSTIVFSTYYISELNYELEKMHKRLRTVSLEQFCTEFECLPNSIMDVFERYKDGSFMVYDTSSQIYYLVFRGMTDREITFEQYCL